MYHVTCTVQNDAIVHITIILSKWDNTIQTLTLLVFYYMNIQLTSILLSSISQFYISNGVGDGAEFNTPPYTGEVTSEAVFTADHLTDTDKQNTTGKYTN